ncbi:MAG: hypothetical protein CH6_1069 [Candidatus Kapaibacterium sp.]|nr:MAG: hypothetical protein CH6_1069 [Candidatus Kapabacteria bacterium]
MKLEIKSTGRNIEAGLEPTYKELKQSKESRCNSIDYD